MHGGKVNYWRESMSDQSIHYDVRQTGCCILQHVEW